MTSFFIYSKAYTNSMHKVSVFKIWIGTVSLVAYLWITLFGLFQITSMDHMHTGGHPCPFMLGQNSICPMDTLHHVAVWESFSHATFSFFNVLLFILIPLSFFYLILSLPPEDVALKRRQKPLHTSLYPELFSRGLLNPKAP